MAGTSDIYSWLYNPQLYYDPRTQSYRTPGFSQATYWEDPTPVRAVTPIRADPTVTPTPPDNSAVAALRGVFPSRSANDAGGSPNGGDIVAGLDPLGGYGLAPDGGYAIPAGDLWSAFSPFGTPDQGWAERLAGMAIGAVPGMIPGAGNLVGRALDFTPGPTAQRDFGRIGALAQREAEQGIPFSQADDPFAEGDLPNSELGWGLAERAAYDMGDRFRGAASPQQVGGPRFDDNGQPTAPRGAAPAAAPQVTLAPQTTPFGETITATNTDGQSAKDAQAADTTKTGGGDVSASTSADGGKADVSGSTTSDFDATKGTGSDTTSPGEPGSPGLGGNESGSAPGGGGYGGGGEGGYGGPGGGQDVGGGGPGGNESGNAPLARGGRVTKRNAVRRGDPPGPDNIYATLQTGESVVPRDVTRGVQAGDPGSALAALQSIGSGAPVGRAVPAAKRTPMRGGGAMAALGAVKGGKRPTAPRR